MNFNDPIHVLLFAFLIFGFVAGVVFAGAIFLLQTHKARRHDRIWVGWDFAKDGDGGCTVYGHYTPDGALHIDRVEFDGEKRG